MASQHDSEYSIAFREELGRLARVTQYLRVAFSTILLAFAGFGPGLLLRFPGTPMPAGAMSQFYAYRPVIFALLFVALVSVLGVLSRRAAELYAALYRVDCRMAEPHQASDYARFLRPPAFPFVLSGGQLVDGLVFVIMLAAYSFWVLVLVETTPLTLHAHQVTGVILGSYGLFAALLVTGFIWRSVALRLRRVSTGTAGNGTGSQ